MTLGDRDRRLDALIISNGERLSPRSRNIIRLPSFLLSKFISTKKCADEAYAFSAQNEYIKAKSDDYGAVGVLISLSGNESYVVFFDHSLFKSGSEF